jgi:hypothetical protein
MVAFGAESKLAGPNRLISPWRNPRGRRLRLLLGLFVVETPRISSNTRRFSASIPSKIRGPIGAEIVQIVQAVASDFHVGYAEGARDASERRLLEMRLACA